MTAVHYYPSKAPLTAFLAAPVYWVLERFGPVSEVSQVLFSRLVVTILPALALLWRYGLLDLLLLHGQGMVGRGAQFEMRGRACPSRHC